MFAAPSLFIDRRRSLNAGALCIRLCRHLPSSNVVTVGSHTQPWAHRHGIPTDRALARHNAVGRSACALASTSASFAPYAEGAHDSARMTEIPLMSSLFISTID